MEFHLIVNGKQEGPFSIEELEQKGLTPESEVWAPGMDDWQQAGDVAELTAVLQRAEFEAAQQARIAAENRATMGQPFDPPIPPTQVPPPQVPRYGTVQEQEQPKKRGCMPWLIAGMILAILFATMVFTCPDRHAHEEAIQEVTKEWLGDKVQENLGAFTGNSGFGSIVNDIVSKIVREWTDSGTEFALTNFLEVDNYIVCSVGHIKIGDEDKTVSFGIFGHVFTFDKNDLEELWAKALDSHESNNRAIVPPMPAPQNDEEVLPDEEATPSNSSIMPDSIMGVEVPKELDTLVNNMVNEGVRQAKEWAKRQIDEL